MLAHPRGRPEAAQHARQRLTRGAAAARRRVCARLACGRAAKAEKNCQNPQGRDHQQQQKQQKQQQQQQKQKQQQQQKQELIDTRPNQQTPTELACATLLLCCKSATYLWSGLHFLSSDRWCFVSDFAARVLILLKLRPSQSSMMRAFCLCFFIF